MSVRTVIETILSVLGLIEKVSRGDKRAAMKLKDIVPKRTHTRMMREAEKARDEAKFGRRR
jgi:hypothetical protein